MFKGKIVSFLVTVGLCLPVLAQSDDFEQISLQEFAEVESELKEVLSPEITENIRWYLENEESVEGQEQSLESAFAATMARSMAGGAAAAVVHHVLDRIGGAATPSLKEDFSEQKFDYAPNSFVVTPVVSAAAHSAAGAVAYKAVRHALNKMDGSFLPLEEFDFDERQFDIH